MHVRYETNESLILHYNSKFKFINVTTIWGRKLNCEIINKEYTY